VRVHRANNSHAGSPDQADGVRRCAPQAPGRPEYERGPRQPCHVWPGPSLSPRAAADHPELFSCQGPRACGSRQRARQHHSGRPRHMPVVALPADWTGGKLRALQNLGQTDGELRRDHIRADSFNLGADPCPARPGIADDRVPSYRFSLPGEESRCRGPMNRAPNGLEKSSP